MKTTTVLATLLLMWTFPSLVKAQKHDVSVHVQAADTAGLKLSIHPMGTIDAHAAMPQPEGLVVKQAVEHANSGLYEIVVVSTTKQLQFIAPLYFEGKLPSNIQLALVDACPRVLVLPDGPSKADRKRAEKQNVQLEALYIYNNVYYHESNEVWTKAMNMTVDDLRAVFSIYDASQKEFCKIADTKLHDYAAISTFLHKQDCINIYNRYHRDAPILAADEIGHAHDMLDTPTALLFSSASLVATQDIPKGTLAERLDYVNRHYSCQEMRENIHQILADNYIRHYNFEHGYQDGLRVLEQASEQYGLHPRFIDRFKERIAAMPGAAFPDVQLIDTAGHKMSFSQFKGKYVYVDLWASWCVPCCREVPHLQKVQQELQNPDVVFLSISIDTTEYPWRERMKQLKMEGHQWLNADNQFCERMNISSIPHFLIYDREGRLHTYDAPRPSHANELKHLLETLN
ncbi:MAG: TlpA family protein disulfide reductase [Bacteroidales bacterium]|nr:TlpA family protein disulfide reductase [Candidatus Physcousia equi]